ncbi:MAG TPA: LysR family transcriptional regulator, partial [Microbacteriaceae bacterium]|nr:LysR family transcriptional regulator [Microbacteriaceae bacterium]
MLDVRQLSVLLAIRTHGSLTQAARALRLSTPTVTHHLDALEAQLDARLVERSKRGAALTPVGIAVAEDAERILGELDRTERMVADLRDAGLSSLRIGTFPSIGSRLLPSAVAALTDEFRLRIEVIEGEPLNLIDMVQSGEIHAALVYDLASDPHLHPRDLETTELFEEEFVVLLAASHPLARQRRIAFEEVAEEAWVLSHHPDEASNRVLRQACQAAGTEPRALLHTDDLNMIHGFVSAGLGVAL